MGGLSRQEVIGWVESTCQAQGVPVKLEDEDLLSRVAVLLGRIEERVDGDGAASNGQRVTDARSA
jgi:hypothetical protein